MTRTGGAFKVEAAVESGPAHVPRGLAGLQAEGWPRARINQSGKSGLWSGRRDILRKQWLAASGLSR